MSTVRRRGLDGKKDPFWLQIKVLCGFLCLLPDLIVADCWISGFVQVLNVYASL